MTQKLVSSLPWKWAGREKRFQHMGVGGGRRDALAGVTDKVMESLEVPEPVKRQPYAAALQTARTIAVSSTSAGKPRAREAGSLIRQTLL